MEGLKTKSNEVIPQIDTKAIYEKNALNNEN